MNLTQRQAAYVLAALRRCQNEDLSGMPHFEEGAPLTEEEIDDLCEELNLPDGDETANTAGEGDTRPYTAIGLYPDSDWMAPCTTAVSPATLTRARHLLRHQPLEAWSLKTGQSLGGISTQRLLSRRSASTPRRSRSYPSSRGIWRTSTIPARKGR